MKKRGLGILVVTAVILCFTLTGCVSTVKYSNDLNSKNAATLELIHKYQASSNITTELGIASINGSYKLWNKHLNILIPEGNHELEITMYYRDSTQTIFWSSVEKISISVEKGKKYLIQCFPTNISDPEKNVVIEFADDNKNILLSKNFVLDDGAYRLIEAFYSN